jgi:hypothetical protein
MTLPDVTEQRLATNFVFALKMIVMQISNILEEAENMFKAIVYFEYMH